jgi:hypothetical protein
MNWKKLSKYYKDFTRPTKESLGDELKKEVVSIRFLGVILIKSIYSLPQALIGIKK